MAALLQSPLLSHQLVVSAVMARLQLCERSWLRCTGRPCIMCRRAIEPVEAEREVGAAGVFLHAHEVCYSSGDVTICVEVVQVVVVGKGLPT